MVTAAIVGCGAIAAVHAATLQEMHDVTLIGCADIRPERAQALAEKAGCAAYSSLDEMLAAIHPDVLHICTPHYLHVPMALQAAALGIAVLCEKPEGITAEQLDALAQAERDGARIGICFQNRYNPSTRQARALLMNNDISGKILGARAFVTWHREPPYYVNSGWRGKKETEGGGVMTNQAIHTLDLLQYLCGYPTTVEGHVSNHHLKGVIDVEDTAELYMTLPSGAPMVMYATTAYAQDSPVMLEIICEKVLLRVDPTALKVIDRRTGLAITPEKAEPARRPKVGKAYWGSGHPSLFRDYYDRLQAGEPFALNAAEGAKASRILLSLYQSSQTGKPVNL